MANVINAHFVFKPNVFHIADDWDQAKCNEFYKQMIVSFQKNVWVDVRAHMHELQQMLQTNNDHLERFEFKSIFFEANLSAQHKTEGIKFKHSLPLSV